MELMKSHLHGGNGFESVDIFFRKLVHVMEMATKQLFTLIDVSGVTATSSSSDVIGVSSVTSRLHEVSIMSVSYTHLTLPTILLV